MFVYIYIIFSIYIQILSVTSEVFNPPAQRASHIATIPLSPNSFHPKWDRRSMNISYIFIYIPKSRVTSVLFFANPLANFSAPSLLIRLQLRCRWSKLLFCESPSPMCPTPSSIILLPPIYVYI